MAAVVALALAIGGPAFVGALGSAGSVHHAPVLANASRLKVVPLTMPLH